jgi:hypothetical protein
MRMTACSATRAASIAASYVGVQIALSRGIERFGTGNRGAYHFDGR